MHTRVFLFELGRMLKQARFWAVVLGCGFFGAYTVFEISPWGNVGVGGIKTVGAFGIFGQHSAWIFAFASPLIAGLTTGGSLAADRHRRYPTLVMVRGVSRKRYLLAKAAAMASGAALATFASFGIILLAALAMLPWEPTTLSAGSERYLLSPRLFAYSPLLYDLFLAGLVFLASASLAMSGLVAGTVTTNEYVAAAVPFVLTLGGAFVTGGVPPLGYLSPDFYLWLVDSYPYTVPLAWRPFAAPLYWLLFGAVCTSISAFLFLGKEPE